MDVLLTQLLRRYYDYGDEPVWHRLRPADLLSMGVLAGSAVKEDVYASRVRSRDVFRSKFPILTVSCFGCNHAAKFWHFW